MFNQRKHFWNHRWFALVIIGLLGFGYWVNQGSMTPTPAESGDGQAVTNQQVDSKDLNEPAVPRGEGGGTQAADPDPGNSEQQEPYYLIKEENRIISIYYCDNEGSLTFFSNTDIAFELLSEADQKLFTKGIIEKNKEDLDELLQDFGS